MIQRRSWAHFSMELSPTLCIPSRKLMNIGSSLPLPAFITLESPTSVGSTCRELDSTDVVLWRWRHTPLDSYGAKDCGGRAYLHVVVCNEKARIRDGAAKKLDLARLVMSGWTARVRWDQRWYAALTCGCCSNADIRSKSTARLVYRQGHAAICRDFKIIQRVDKNDDSLSTVCLPDLNIHNVVLDGVDEAKPSHGRNGWNTLSLRVPTEASLWNIGLRPGRQTRICFISDKWWLKISIPLLSQVTRCSR